MDRITTWLMWTAIALIVLTIAVQIGIHEGRRLERDDKRYSLDHAHKEATNGSLHDNR